MKNLNKTFAVLSAFGLALSFALISGCSDGPESTSIDKTKSKKIVAEEEKPIPFDAAQSVSYD